MAHAFPISRQASAAGSVVSVANPTSGLRHPTPDLQSLQGAYVRNVQNLERSAEEMSSGGSDIAEEIRKMNALSRQGSIQSSHHGEISVVRTGAMERENSARSSRFGASRRSNAGANGSTRWNGYSPNGFVTSPVGSVSGAWSHASVSRAASGSKRYSHLRQVSEPTQEGRPLDSPLRPTLSDDVRSEPEQFRDPSRSSFATRYDEIAGQIEESLQHVPPSPQKRTASFRDEEAYGDNTSAGAVTPPDRPRSTDTYREAQTAFQDFDGVHFNPDTDEFVEYDDHGNELRRVSARSSDGRLSVEAAALLQTPRARPPSHVAQPPGEGMVYYPAPVPVMLNLPKRLSNPPAATVQSKRRSQMLAALSPEEREAAPWLAAEEVTFGDGDIPGYYNRQSVMTDIFGQDRQSKRMSANSLNLPAHARASMFFEHQPVRHDVELKHGSAVATLDSILEASANAPVSAFTDHPYAGNVRSSVYAPEHKPRKSAGSNTVSSSPKGERKHKHQSSSISGFFRRVVSSDETATMDKSKGNRVSTMSDLDYQQGPNKLRKSSSRLSLGQELERPQESIRTSLGAISEPGLESGLVVSAQEAIDPEDEPLDGRPPTAMTTGRIPESEQIEKDFAEGDAQEDVEEDGEISFVKPSTLLAELQIRKAQQKSRGKTAATAFPQGMHSTLLQLDAVEEIAKRKRKVQRIDLAWEDPHQRALHVDTDKEDEDVPLGMLFQSKDGRNHRRVGDGKDFERPLGLIAKRQMEEEEPLSNRRNRLRGGRAPSLSQKAEMLPNANPPVENEVEPENETLGQRLKRMKETSTSDAVPKEDERIGSGFADELLSQFAGLDTNDKHESAKQELLPKPTPSPALDPQETLGQRKARLQREREVNGGQRNLSGATRPPLVTGGSFASLLTANPAGQRQAAKTYEPTQGSLLYANSTMETRQKTQLQNTNMNASSHNLGKPLIDARPQNQHAPSGLLANERNKPSNGGFASGTYNNGMGGVQLQTNSGTPMVGMNGTNGYFPSPTTMPHAGYGQTYGYGYGMPGYYPQMQMQMPMQMQMQMQHTAFPQQQAMNPMTYGALPGGAMTSPYMMGSGFVGNAYNPGMVGGTYASYAQNMGGAGMGMGMNEEELTNQQRVAIDRWRLGVAPQ